MPYGKFRCHIWFFGVHISTRRCHIDVVGGRTGRTEAVRDVHVRYFVCTSAILDAGGRTEPSRPRFCLSRAVWGCRGRLFDGSRAYMRRFVPKRQNFLARALIALAFVLCQAAPASAQAGRRLIEYADPFVGTEN